MYHCINVHNEIDDALKPGDTPKEPMYLNWKEYIEGYPDVPF